MNLHFIPGMCLVFHAFVKCMLGVIFILNRIVDGGFFLYFQKGIKRKADAMNPMIGNSNLDAFSPGLGEKMGKISSRRESGRQIKKVNKDLPDSQVNIRVILLIYI